MTYEQINTIVVIYDEANFRTEYIKDSRGDLYATTVIRKAVGGNPEQTIVTIYTNGRMTWRVFPSAQQITTSQGLTRMTIV